MSRHLSFTCPFCRHTETIPSGMFNLIACSRCGQVSRLMEGQVLHGASKLEKAAASVSGLKPGTKGHWNGNSFTITGRTACWFGAWMVNYWTLLLEDGHFLLLEEAAGKYAIWHKKAPGKIKADEQVFQLKPGVGKVTIFPGKNYQLYRKSTARKMEAEGICYAFDDDGSFKLYELYSGDGARYNFVSQLKGGQTPGFEVTPVERATLALENTNAPASPEHSIECGTCKHLIQLKTHPYAQSVVCGHCGTYWSLKGGTTVKERGKRQDNMPAIELYAKGILKDVEYQLTGFCVKADPDGYEWREYSLFNPEKGFAFLSEFNGHWMFLQELDAFPKYKSLNAHSITAEDGEEYLLYNRYNPKLKDASGEFPEEVFHCGGRRISEYISPPEIRIMEYDKDECVEWLKGEHISRNDIQKAFGNAVVFMPPKVGTGAIEPVPFTVNPYLLKVSAVISLLFLAVVYLVTAGMAEKKLVYEQSFVMLGDQQNAYLSTPFTLTKKRSNLEIEIDANVSNSWFELSGILVNTKTGAEYEFSKGVEYYFGVSDGESWSEGSRTATVLLNEIPAGEYILRFSPASEAYNQLREFYVKAVADVPPGRNFFIVAVLMLLPFGLVYFFVFNRERKRWEYSAFSPQN